MRKAWPLPPSVNLSASPKPNLNERLCESLLPKPPASTLQLAASNVRATWL